MEVAGRPAHGPLAAAVRELWFLRGPAPARYERIFPMTDVHLIVNLSPQPYRVLEAAATTDDERSAFIVVFGARRFSPRTEPMAAV